MPSFVLELYVPRGRSFGDVAELAREAAAAASRGGIPIRYLRSTYLAEDETCFHVFEAHSREAVVEAARRAGIADARVTAAIESRGAAEVQPSERE